MLDLAEAKRVDFGRHSPVFHRAAPDVHERQEPYFLGLIEDSSTTVMVHDSKERIDGFIIALLVSPPPVYDPGGLSRLIDDLVVLSPKNWPQTGSELVLAAS